jgi:hypothetical protein
MCQLKVYILCTLIWMMEKWEGIFKKDVPNGKGMRCDF